MSSRREAQSVLARLRAEAPWFASTPAGPHDRPPSRVLEWLVGEVPLGGRSLEIGCGWSTLALGLVADHHVAVSPDPAEHEALRRWAKEADVALDGVDLVAARAEHHLPAATADGTLEPGRLDLVLVDGDHAHPHPALDVAFAAPLVRPGGLLAVERTRIRSVAQAVRWLRADTAGWTVRHGLDDALVLQRRDSNAMHIVAMHGSAMRRGWWDQPGNAEVPSLEDRARTLKRRLRRGAP